MEVFSRTSRRRGAFTLVELLTVIVIIGILAGLITAAVGPAMRRAREARVTLEMNLLSDALEKYKEKYGDYPPDDLSDAAAVRAHLRRAFPQYARGADPYTQFTTDLSPFSLDPNSMTRASALVFWLGGCPTYSGGEWVPSGFGLDPEQPFRLISQTSEPLFPFDPDRLGYDTNGQVAYFPDISGAETAVAPYVYFRARENRYTVPSAGIGPYARAASNPSDVNTYQWYNPRKFQIISAGMDNNFGTGSQVLTEGIPAGQEAHYNNLTNFTEGKLEDLFE